MSFEYADRVKETSATTGTGPLDLGGAVGGYQTFVAGIGDTNTCTYCIEDANGAWETGTATISDASPDTAARSVDKSSNGDALINCSGSVIIYATPIATPLNTNQTKLDAIESAATADQTAGEIEAIVSHDNLIGVTANEHIDWTNAPTEDLSANSIMVDAAEGIAWESGISWITHNDGAGNCQIRYGNRYISDDEYHKALGATYIGANIDSEECTLTIKVASTTGVVLDDTTPVVWGGSLTQTAVLLKWAGGDFQVSAGDIIVSGTVDGVDIAAEETRLANTSGTNTGDQTTIVGITGTVAQFNTAITDATLSGNNTGDEAAASESVSGVTEHSTTAEIDTGTATDKAMCPDQFQASSRNIRYLAFRVVAPAADVEVATGVGGEFRIPFAGTILQDDSDKTQLMAYVDTAGTTGTMVVDVHLNGTTIMTTNKLDIETTDKATIDAATQPDLTTTTLAKGDIVTIDVDTIQTTAAKGLVVHLAIRET